MKYPIPYPPRFETKEDAELFLNCVKHRLEFPPEKTILPYEYVDGMARVNKRYSEANFELTYTYEPIKHKRLSDAQITTP